MTQYVPIEDRPLQEQVNFYAKMLGKEREKVHSLQRSAEMLVGMLHKQLDDEQQELILDRLYMNVTDNRD